MKTTKLISILILALTVMIIAGSCATSKKTYVAQEDEELYGIWINPDYNEPLNKSGKSVFYSNLLPPIYFSWRIFIFVIWISYSYLLF